MKNLMIIKRTGKSSDKDIHISEFVGPKKKKMIQVSQGIANYLNDLDEPGFIQLSVDDAKSLTFALNNFIGINYEKIFMAAKKFSDEWREWHKPEYGSFGIISAANELDHLFPGKKACGDAV